jgi:glutaconate CoA-transferase subunit B
MPVTNQELMVIVASRVFRDGEVVFVGVGLPNLAANLARRIRSPGLVMIYESGIVGAKPFRMPLSVGDAGVTANSQSILNSFEIFTWLLQGGRIDVGFLGGAQVDRWGNLNSTVIGPYDKPDVRLPGSGGAGDVASLANRTIIIMPHERRARAGGLSGCRAGVPISSSPTSACSASTTRARWSSARSIPASASTRCAARPAGR